MKTSKKVQSDKTQKIKADVVVIGAGAGLAAAVSAAERGKKVVVLEKSKKIGGNAILAAGFLAAESPVQRRLKIEVSKEQLFRASMESGRWLTNPKIVKAFIDKSGDTVRWLEDMGLTFIDVPYCYENQTPRIYHAIEGDGVPLIRVMEKRLNQLGGTIMRETAGEKIELNKKGIVSGVIARQKKQLISIKAKTAIIATGGFSGNKRLLKKYYPYYSKNLRVYGKGYNGDGLKLALEAGAATDGLVAAITMGPLFEGAKHAHLVSMESNTIWVNKNGSRFINEDVISSLSSNALSLQPDQISFSIFDDRIKRGFAEEGLAKAVEPERYPAGTKMENLDAKFEREIKRGTMKISRSLNEIAKWIGTDARSLQQTVEDYNGYCANGLDEEFYKHRRFLQALNTPPFYALRCGQAFHGTLGGIKINHNMEVIGQKGMRIPGLYASGNDTGGWIAGTYPYHLTGTALSFALNSARIAGENAASFI